MRHIFSMSPILKEIDGLTTAEFRKSKDEIRLENMISLAKDYRENGYEDRALKTLFLAFDSYPNEHKIIEMLVGEIDYRRLSQKLSTSRLARLLEKTLQLYQAKRISLSNAKAKHSWKRAMLAYYACGDLRSRERVFRAGLKANIRDSRFYTELEGLNRELRCLDFLKRYC